MASDTTPFKRHGNSEAAAMEKTTGASRVSYSITCAFELSFSCVRNSPAAYFAGIERAPCVVGGKRLETLRKLYFQESRDWSEML